MSDIVLRAPHLRPPPGAARRPGVRREGSALHAPAPPTGEKKTAAFSLGDRVVHTAFGPGEITKMTPMGGDALIEITFDGPGVKRLMLRAAAQHMKKEE